MRMSGGVESSRHCCVVLAAADRPVPALRLAELPDGSASYLAKQLQALSGAELVRCAQRQSGGYVLARAPQDITVLDVVKEVDACQLAQARRELAEADEGGTSPVRLADIRAMPADRLGGPPVRAHFRTWQPDRPQAVPRRSVPHRVVVLEVRARARFGTTTAALAGVEYPAGREQLPSGG